MTRSLEQTSGLENKFVGIGCKFFPPLNYPTTDSSMCANEITTLHLCMDTKCLLLQLPHMDYVPAQCFIRSLLANSGVITFVGVEVQNMWHKIMSEYIVEYLRSECKVVDVHLLAKPWFPMSYRGRPRMKAHEYGVAGQSMRKSTIGIYRRYGADWVVQPGLKALARHLIGMNREKPIHVCRSNLEARVLMLEQVEHACIDAYAS